MGDDAWPMPLLKNCHCRRSAKADLVNAVFASKAGSITAAKFLQEFVDPKVSDEWCIIS